MLGMQFQLMHQNNARSPNIDFIFLYLSVKNVIITYSFSLF